MRDSVESGPDENEENMSGFKVLALAAVAGFFLVAATPKTEARSPSTLE
jgi:hypothetical protein